MKKILTIGDIHGREIWKEFVDIKSLLSSNSNIPEYLYIFLGDYVDSYDISGDKIIENLLEIIKFKTLYPDNVILILGNHDISYIINKPWLPINYNGSGFDLEIHQDLYTIFSENSDLFQVAFQIDNYLFTHAGVHKNWYNDIFKKELGDSDEIDTISEQLNDAYKYKIECLFDVDYLRGGYNNYGGPFWCDKKLLVPLENYHQIVGHTPVSDIDMYKIDDNTSITFCDVLGRKKSYYTIIIK